MADSPAPANRGSAGTDQDLSGQGVKTRAHEDQTSGQSATQDGAPDVVDSVENQARAQWMESEKGKG